MIDRVSSNSIVDIRHENPSLPIVFELHRLNYPVGKTFENEDLIVTPWQAVGFISNQTAGKSTCGTDRDSWSLYDCSNVGRI